MLEPLDIISTLRLVRDDLDGYAYDEASHTETGICNCWICINVDRLDAALIKVDDLQLELENIKGDIEARNLGA